MPFYLYVAFISILTIISAINTIEDTYGVYKVKGAIEKQWLFQSKDKWDREWTNNKWAYQENVPVERSRLAIIGGVFCHGGNRSVLDIGCGEGGLSDFLSPMQRRRYLGVDISASAIHLAKSRRPHIRFKCAAAHELYKNSSLYNLVY